MQRVITLRTDRRNSLYDITAEVSKAVDESGIINGLVSVYARGSTAAIMIQENWDQSVQNDVVTCSIKLFHLVSGSMTDRIITGIRILRPGLVGPSETIPIIEGKPGLSTWQNIFFCEFDGPRERREVVITIIGDYQV